MPVLLAGRRDAVGFPAAGVALLFQHDELLVEVHALSLYWRHQTFLTDPVFLMILL